MRPFGPRNFWSHTASFDSAASWAYYPASVLEAKQVCRWTFVQRPVQPGETFIYRFTPPGAGTFWYHPHLSETEQLEKGFHGALIVRAADELALDDEKMINGKKPEWRSLEDVINVPPQATVRIAWYPDDRLGSWMYHWHILEHHASGMMAHFVGQLLYVVVTLLHTGGEANHHPAIFAAYAGSGIWTTVHAAQFACMAIFLSGLFALFSALDVQGRNGETGESTRRRLNDGDARAVRRGLGGRWCRAETGGRCMGRSCGRRESSALCRRRDNALARVGNEELRELHAGPRGAVGGRCCALGADPAPNCLPDRTLGPHVFDLLMQGASGRRGELGIGLWVVRERVASHGGTVSAHSDGIDKGSEFIITLPSSGKRQCS